MIKSGLSVSAQYIDEMQRLWKWGTPVALYDGTKVVMHNYDMPSRSYDSFMACVIGEYLWNVESSLEHGDKFSPLSPKAFSLLSTEAMDQVESINKRIMPKTCDPDCNWDFNIEVKANIEKLKII